jgi:hypothetical protein
MYVCMYVCMMYVLRVNVCVRVRTYTWLWPCTQNVFTYSSFPDALLHAVKITVPIGYCNFITGPYSLPWHSTWQAFQLVHWTKRLSQYSQEYSTYRMTSRRQYRLLTTGDVECRAFSSADFSYFGVPSTPNSLFQERIHVVVVYILSFTLIWSKYYQETIRTFKLWSEWHYIPGV